LRSTRSGITIYTLYNLPTCIPHRDCWHKEGNDLATCSTRASMIDCVRHFHEMHYSQFFNRRIAELQSPAESTNPKVDLIHIDKLSGNHIGGITTHVLVGANLPTFTSTTFETTILRAQLLLASNPHTFDYAWEGIRQWATISIWTFSFFCAVAQHRAYGSTCERMAQPASMKLNLRAYGSTCEHIAQPASTAISL
jgi:hypothetical protein